MELIKYILLKIRIDVVVPLSMASDETQVQQ